MSMFGDDFREEIWLYCRNAHDDGRSVKDILAALVDVMRAVIDYFVEDNNDKS